MTSPSIPRKQNPKSFWQFLFAALMILLAIALTVQKIRSPDKDRGKPAADAASGRAETPKPSRLRPTSGSELGSREKSGNRKPRPNQAELPDDPSQIKELTPEQAKLLVAKFKGDNLSLSGLTTLDADTAKALADSKWEDLNLNGLTTLNTETAQALAEFEGKFLILSGLTTLNADTAKALAEFEGGLFLSGLTTLDADTAKALRETKGKVSLPQDIPITPKTRISKRPSKSKPTPVPPALVNQPTSDVNPATAAANNQPSTFAWLGIIGAVVLLVCYRIWRKRRLQH